MGGAGFAMVTPACMFVRVLVCWCVGAARDVCLCFGNSHGCHPSMHPTPRPHSRLCPSVSCPRRHSWCVVATGAASHARPHNWVPHPSALPRQNVLAPMSPHNWRLPGPHSGTSTKCSRCHGGSQRCWRTTKSQRRRRRSSPRHRYRTVTKKTRVTCGKKWQDCLRKWKAARKTA